jgi:hypothetical protein
MAAASGDAPDNCGIRVNPPRSQRFDVAPGDGLIVLAEE